MQLKKRLVFFYRKRSSEKIFRSNVMKKDEEEKMVTYFCKRQYTRTICQSYI